MYSSRYRQRCASSTDSSCTSATSHCSVVAHHIRKCERFATSHIHIERVTLRRMHDDAFSTRETGMEPTSRRQFLKRSSAVAAAAGVVAAVPAGAAKALSPSSKHDDREPALPDHPDVDVPVIAHV